MVSRTFEVPLTTRRATIFLYLTKPLVWHLNPKGIYVGRETFPLAVQTPMLDPVLIQVKLPS
jgi:hypothetical protein